MLVLINALLHKTLKQHKYGRRYASIYITLKGKFLWHKKYAYEKGKNCISVHNEGQAYLLDLVMLL